MMHSQDKNIVQHSHHRLEFLLADIILVLFMSGNIEYKPSHLQETLFFGDLPIGTGQNCGTSDSTRGLSMGGASPATPAVVADIEYVTIATRGLLLLALVIY